MIGEEEGAELSSGEELEVGGAVTAEDDPEEDEDVDLSVAAAASAGLTGSSVGFGPEGLSGALDSCVESTVGAGGLLSPPSGRTAVPENKKMCRKSFEVLLSNRIFELHFKPD